MARRWWESTERSRKPASLSRLSASSKARRKRCPPTTCTVPPGSVWTPSAPSSLRSASAFRHHKCKARQEIWHWTILKNPSIPAFLQYLHMETTVWLRLGTDRDYGFDGMQTPGSSAWNQTVQPPYPYFLPAHIRHTSFRIGCKSWGADLSNMDIIT